VARVGKLQHAMVRATAMQVLANFILIS